MKLNFLPRLFRNSPLLSVPVLRRSGGVPKLFNSTFYILHSTLLLFLSSCIENDIPYPHIPQRILAIAAQGESKSAYIDSLAYEVNIYLDETTDIRNVRFSEYRVTEGAVSDPDLSQGVYDMKTPLFVTLSRFQEYFWEIKAHQEIPRYFEVEGEIGQSIVDAAACRVVVSMPEGTDLSKLQLLAVKLGPEGITTMSPDLKPGPIDLTYPLRVEVTAWDRTEIWTIYAQFTDQFVTTNSVDAWSKVVWAYGSGPADGDNGFEYRKAGDDGWTDVPKQYITNNQGSFSCYIPHLEPLTDYEVRAVSGENRGEVIAVKTQGTADIPDGDFEQWSMGGTNGNMWQPWAQGGTRFWDTGNRGSITLGVNLTTPTDYTVTGSGTAARCETMYVNLYGIGKLGAGSIFTGEYLRTDGTNGVLGFGRTWNLRPTKLKGYYRYQGKNIDYASSELSYMKGRPDTCHIYVALTDWTQPFEVRTKPADRNLFNQASPSVIAYGELTFAGEMSGYQEFEIKLDYRDTWRVPTYLQITCSASKYGDYFTGGNGSVLYVDQFSFDYDY